MSNIWAAFVTPENLKLIADLKKAEELIVARLDPLMKTVAPDLIGAV